MQVTYLGHSCYLLSYGGYQVLFDPFITGNTLAKDVIDIETLECDFILVSHAHYDHTTDVEAIARRTGALIVSNYEISEHYAHMGLPTHGMNIGGSFDFPFGTVKATYAQHSSSFPDGKYGGNPMGFLITWADKTFYYSGDTGLFSDMRLIGDSTHIEFAFLPIGDNFTMGPEDALAAAKYLNVNKVLAMHFDTFPLIEVDHMLATMLAKRNEIELILPDINQTLTV